MILFLVDNSASLPPLDPEEKRVEALEKMFTFLKGRPYRLILFGGRREIFVDDAIKYRNNGQWTDFYFAFDKARELVAAEYPPGTEFRMVLITDAILDPGPADWADMSVPEGVDLKAHVVERTLALIQEMNIPLYVILVGEPPTGGTRATPSGRPASSWTWCRRPTARRPRPSPRAGRASSPTTACCSRSSCSASSPRRA